MPNTPARPVPLPRTWSVGGTEIVALLIANGVLILAMWLRHGGLDQLDTLGGQLTAVGQVTAVERGLHARAVDDRVVDATSELGRREEEPERPDRGEGREAREREEGAVASHCT